MAKTTLNITRANIKDGIPENGNHCPIALRVKKQFAKLPGFDPESVLVLPEVITFQQDLHPPSNEPDFYSAKSVREYAQDMLRFADLLEQCQHTGVDVDIEYYDGIVSSAKIYHEYYMPTIASHFVNEFDAGNKVQPFSFEIGTDPVAAPDGAIDRNESAIDLLKRVSHVYQTWVRLNVL